MPKSFFYRGKRTAGWVFAPKKNDLDYECGYYSVESELVKLLHDGLNVPLQVFHQVPVNIALWKSTKNPHYVDVAILICTDCGFQLTEYLLQQVQEASQMRLNGNPKTAVKPTALAVKNSSATFQVFSWMAHLCATGLSIDQSSEKAAMLFIVEFPELAKRKASGLSRQYHKRMEEYGLYGKPLNEVVKEIHLSDLRLSAYWKRIADSIPECDIELLGDRR